MQKKKLALILFFIIGMGLMLGACSEKTFKAAPGSAFTQCVPDRPEITCVLICDEFGECFERYDYNIKVGKQIKDILFVNDNSGSMYQEQVRMGSMFPDFFNMLTNVDYRIAITTTDVSSTANPSADDAEKNGFGAFQDGRLVPFQETTPVIGNRFYLDGSESAQTEQDLFNEAITWEQTLICEENNFDVDNPTRPFCPNGDERAILAAALTIENNYNNFIRNTGQLDIVILSDEDEGSRDRSFRDENREDPGKFIELFKREFPLKSLVVHSVIIQPGDTACFNEQQVPGEPPGFYGEVYAELTALTQGGIPANICASDIGYSEQLKDIARSISQVREVLPCSPIDNKVQIDFVNNTGLTLDITENFDQNEVIFNQGLPFGTEIRFRFDCVND